MVLCSTNQTFSFKVECIVFKWRSSPTQLYSLGQRAIDTSCWPYHTHFKLKLKLASMVGQYKRIRALHVPKIAAFCLKVGLQFLDWFWGSSPNLNCRIFKFNVHKFKFMSGFAYRLQAHSLIFVKKKEGRIKLLLLDTYKSSRTFTLVHQTTRLILALVICDVTL